MPRSDATTPLLAARKLSLRVAVLIVLLPVGCGQHSASREADCIGTASQDSPVSNATLPDSATAVSLAIRTLVCSGSGRDLQVGSFERDTATIVIRLDPRGSSLGGGALVQVMRGGRVRVVERYQ